MNKDKIRKILTAITPDETQDVFAEFDSQVEKLKQGLKDKVEVKTLAELNAQLDKFRKRLDFAPLMTAMKGVETGVDKRISDLSQAIDGELTKFVDLMNNQEGVTKNEIAKITKSIAALQAEAKNLSDNKTIELSVLRTNLNQLEDAIKRADETFLKIEGKIEAAQSSNGVMKSEIDAQIEDALKEIEKVRRELTNRINSMPTVGGNMNRNIAIGSNASALSKYTDINIKAGNNVTITYQNNETTKYLDLTIAASGGASTAGVVRSIETIIVSSVVGAVAGTDYVVIANAGIKVTLPTAVGNENLYTIKNVAASSVLIATTGGQTIDSNAELILATQFTSVDLISDNSNWAIT